MEAGGPIRRNNRNGARYSRICFTINNWTQQEYDDLLKNSWKWMVVGKEIGENQVPHLQGAAVLGKQMALTTIKKLPGMARAHIEPMMGTPEDSLVYCSKQDAAAYTAGSMPKEGKRREMDEAATALLNGATMRQMAEEHTSVTIKYSKGLMVTRSLLAKPRTQPPKVVWIYGPTGVGKTRLCREFADKFYEGDIWMSSGDLHWFDGYDGQRVVVLDDFRGKHCSFSFLLRLLDRYPFRVPFKGGFVEWNPELIFITCPYAPDKVFETRMQYLPEDMKQLQRRLTKTYWWYGNATYDSCFLAVATHVAERDKDVVSANRDQPLIDLTEEIEETSNELAKTIPFSEDSDLEAYGDGPECVEEVEVEEDPDIDDFMSELCGSGKIMKQRRRKTLNELRRSK